MLIDDLDDALAEARADIADLMTDTCRITVRGTGGQGTFNEATGKYDNPGAPVVVYEGICRWQIRADINSNVVEPVVAEREWTYQTSTLELPVLASVPADRPDVIAVCLTARYDPSLVGRTFGVLGGHHKSQAHSRRLRIKEVTG